MINSINGIFKQQHACHIGSFIIFLLVLSSWVIWFINFNKILLRKKKKKISKCDLIPDTREMIFFLKFSKFDKTITRRIMQIINFSLTNLQKYFQEKNISNWINALKDTAAFPNPIIQNFSFTYLYKEIFTCTNLNKFKRLDLEKQNPAFLKQSSFLHLNCKKKMYTNCN